MLSNSLDPDQVRHFVWPDLCPNCLQMLPADDTSRLRANSLMDSQAPATCESWFPLYVNA